VVIVDNFIYSFAFHLSNGIPCVPFFGEKDDRELIKIIKHFTCIAPQDDLRIPNEKSFKLDKIYKSDIESFIQYYDFDYLQDQLNDQEEDNA
jgi:hypothetical protein